jgi:hypothetical protein
LTGVKNSGERILNLRLKRMKYNVLKMSTFEWCFFFCCLRIFCNKWQYTQQ